jgi:hypothetical protein
MVNYQTRLDKRGIIFGAYYEELKPLLPFAFLLPIFGSTAYASAALPSARIHSGYVWPRKRHAARLDFPSDARRSLAHLTDTVAPGGRFDEALSLQPCFTGTALDVRRRE